MPKGRPVSEDTNFKVSVHNIGGHRYASTQRVFIGEDGKSRRRHVHWGTLDENNRFSPTTNYLLLTPSERKKLIFPKEWDLSAIRKGSQSDDRRGAVTYEAGDVDRQYGATWLLDQIAEQTGVKQDLIEATGGNVEKTDKILTMAYFPFVDNLSYSHLARWQREVKAPTEYALTPDAVTRLTQSITEQERMDLFRMRAKRIGKDELVGIDSSSISTYGFNLVDIRWGHNKEKLPLRQTVEVVVYSLTSHMPIFYLELPGNMPDSRTIELIITELEHAGFKNLILITDRGYESIKNIELYISKRQKILTSVKTTQGDVLKLIKGIDMTHRVPTGMKYSKEDKLFYQQYEVKYSVKGNGDNVIEAPDMRINLYYSPSRQAEDICRLQEQLEEQKEEAARVMASKEKLSDTGTFTKSHRLLAVEYNEDNTIKSFAEDMDAFDTRLRVSGFFASKSIGVDLDPLAAKDTYGMRDEQEKTFQMQKGPLGQDRLHTWSESSKHGRMFICFVGLMLASWLRHKMSTNEYLRTHFDSVESILEEMRSIRCIEHNGHRKFITPFVGAQVEICKELGFEIPKGCAPTYVSKAKQPAKRGPKPKPITENLDY